MKLHLPTNCSYFSQAIPLSNQLPVGNPDPEVGQVLCANQGHLEVGVGGIRVSVLDLKLLTAGLSRGSAHQEPRTIVAVGGGVGVWAGCVLTSGSALQMRRALFLGASALLLLVLNHNVVREVK